VIVKVRKLREISIIILLLVIIIIIKQHLHLLLSQFESKSNLKTIGRMIYDAVVIGAGLSGIYALDQILTNKPNAKILVLEATNQIGGRLRTIDGNDFGATWCWPQNDEIVMKLIREFDIQCTSPSATQILVDPFQEEQVRLRGGTHQLVANLANKWKNKFELLLNHPVYRISRIQNMENEIQSKSKDNIVTIYADEEKNQQYLAKHVVIAIPPKICAKKIEFYPNLPNNVSQALNNTDTWMEKASKVFYEFSRPFWREYNANFSMQLSGWFLFDASFDLDGRYILCAFNTGHGDSSTSEKVDLNKIFGPFVHKFLIKSSRHDWSKNKWVNADYCPNNEVVTKSNMCRIGIHPILRNAVASSIHFASTETEYENGHMEGALRSGFRVANEICKMLNCERKTN